MPGIRLQERMAGWIQFNLLEGDFNGPTIPEINIKYPFEININSYCNKLNYPIPCTFTGFALLPGFPQPLNFPNKLRKPKTFGKMSLSHKGVNYDINCNIPQIGKVFIVGSKIYANGTISWNKYRNSLITLPIEIFKDDKKIGFGQLKYLKPLWQFPFGLSWAQDFNAFQPRLRFCRDLMDLASILYPELNKLSNKDEIFERITKQVNDLPWILYRLTHLSHFIVKVITFLYFFRTLKKLNKTQRERFATLITKIRLFHLALISQINISFGSIFGSKEFMKKSDQNIPVPPEEVEDEAWMKLNMNPTSQHSEEEIEVDVVIVGSGAAGGAYAYEMARKGHAVAIVEEGNYFKRIDMTGDRIDMMTKLYRHQGNSFAVSNCPIWLPTGRCVGGSTTINSGTSMRPPDNIIESWKTRLGLNDLGLEKYYPEVEKMLDTKPVEEKIVGGISNVLKDGLKDSNQCKTLTRAETGCDGQSYCVIGCPIGAKRSTDISYVAEAMKNNAYLFSNYKVEKILMENNKAIGIKATLPNYGDEFSLTIKARQVVLAAGTLNTPRLIKKSKLNKNLKQLGKNLTIHPALTVGAIFNKTVREKLFVPQSVGVLGIKSDNYILEGYTLPNDSVPVAFINFGSELDYIMDNISKFTNFSSILKDPVKGRLLLTNNSSTPIYFLNSKVKKALKESMIFLGNIFFDAGALNVYVPVSGFSKLQNKNELNTLLQTKISSFSFTLSAYHPLGTCQMGDSPKNSVVNRNGEVWGVENLLAIDGSIIPGPLKANPQVTIMANALRIANIMEYQLK